MGRNLTTGSVRKSVLYFPLRPNHRKLDRGQKKAVVFIRKAGAVLQKSSWRRSVMAVIWYS